METEGMKTGKPTGEATWPTAYSLDEIAAVIFLTLRAFKKEPQQKKEEECLHRN